MHTEETTTDFADNTDVSHGFRGQETSDGSKPQSVESVPIRGYGATTDAAEEQPRISPMTRMPAMASAVKTYGSKTAIR
jgi:hypothetical protein